MPRTLGIVLIAALPLALAACGAGPAAGLAAAPSATPPPATAAALPPTATATAVAARPTADPGGLPATTLTLADDGTTVHYRVGATIGLALRAPDGYLNWQVAAPDPRILAPAVNPGAAAARGMTLRAFRAVGAGQTVITATTRPDCPPGQACPALVRAFKVTVVVAG